jgi:hypothetical protein
MGAVAMESRSLGFRDKGYPVTEATLYIYCDKCGSFNMMTHITLTKWMIILIPVIILFFGLRAGLDLRCIPLLLLVALFLPWKDILLSYKCRKFGNQQIAESNILNYQPYDKSVIDVPDHLTQKRYIHEDVLHFSQFT